VRRIIDEGDGYTPMYPGGAVQVKASWPIALESALVSTPEPMKGETGFKVFFSFRFNLYLYSVVTDTATKAAAAVSTVKGTTAASAAARTAAGRCTLNQVDPWPITYSLSNPYPITYQVKKPVLKSAFQTQPAALHRGRGGRDSERDGHVVEQVIPCPTAAAIGRIIGKQGSTIMRIEVGRL
jgi:hypothetical protein